MHTRDRSGAGTGIHDAVTRPVAAEADLTFAGLGDLLEPVLDSVLDAVPDPQARALRVALLLEESAEPTDARTLGVAFLSVLRALAEERPLLVVVDDVQWLDPSSAAVLAYAGRRLQDDRVALLLARRVMHADGVTALLDDVWRLELGGLSAGALHRLLRERLGVVLSRPVVRRVHEISGGNPFYALEISRLSSSKCRGRRRVGPRLFLVRSASSSRLGSPPFRARRSRHLSSPRACPSHD